MTDDMYTAFVWGTITSLMLGVSALLASKMGFGDTACAFLLISLFIGGTFTTIGLLFLLGYVAKYGLICLYTPMFYIFIAGITLLMLNLKKRPNNEGLLTFGVLLTSLSGSIVGTVHFKSLLEHHLNIENGLPLS